LAVNWELISAVIGGVIGALTGGIPSWALAKRQSNETLRRDREQRVEVQKALAFSTAVKLLHIINSTISLGSGLTDHSQKMTVAARATAEKNTVGHRS
jgi:hypothetical protein